MVWDLSKIGDEQVRSCTCIAQSTHSLVYIVECGDAGSLHEDAWHLHGLTWECLAPLFKVDSNTAEILKPDGYLHDQAAVQYPERLHCSLRRLFTCATGCAVRNSVCGCPLLPITSREMQGLGSLRACMACVVLWCTTCLCVHLLSLLGRHLGAQSAPLLAPNICLCRQYFPPCFRHVT